MSVASQDDGTNSSRSRHNEVLEMLKSAARDISKGSQELSKGSQEPFKKKISFSDVSSKDQRLNT